MHEHHHIKTMREICFNAFLHQKAFLQAIVCQKKNCVSFVVQNVLHVCESITKFIQFVIIMFYEWKNEKGERMLIICKCKLAL